MSTQGYVYDDSCIADQQLNQFRIVVYGAASVNDQPIHVTYPTTQYANGIVGVTQFTNNVSGDNILVRRAGITRIETAQPGVVAGQPLLAYDSVGRASFRTGAGASGDGILGQAEFTNAASGDVIECWLNIRQRN
jgi:hypothetical protein